MPSCRIERDADAERLLGISSAMRLIASSALVAFGLCAFIWAGVSFPETAYANQVKHAIPSITKEVSLDGKAYSDQVAAQAGARVNYKLTLTMPERVEELETVDYTLNDVPDSAITVNVQSASACVMSSSGDVKTRLTAKASLASGKITVALGNLKLQCPNIASDDRVVVRYDAQVSPTAAAGRHPNVAKLVYDLGEGHQETAEIMALVTVAGSSTTGSQVVKTGDSLASVSLLCLAISTASGLGLCYARRRLWR